MTQNVSISFKPRSRLPPGGYDYAVLVLVGYPLAAQAPTPRCAVSSDMNLSQYGVTPARGSVRSRPWARPRLKRAHPPVA